MAAVEREKRLVDMEKRELALQTEEVETNNMECGEKDNDRKRSISDPETETKETKKLDTKLYSCSQASGRGRHRQLTKSNSFEPDRLDEGGGGEDEGGK